MVSFLKQSFNDNLQIIYFTKEFNDEYKHIEDTSYALAIKSVHQSSTTCLGMVVYMESGFYKDSKDENDDLHIPGVSSELGRQIFVFTFKQFFKEVYNKVPSQILFGHEHGTQNGKCHMQICVTFSEAFRGTVKPASFVITSSDPDYSFIDGHTFLFMAQKAKHPRALAQYCMKDGDFFYMDPQKAIKNVFKKDAKGEPTEKVDAFATVVQNRSILNQEQSLELLLNHEPRTAMTMYRNLEYCVKNIIQDSLPEFKWTYPEHLVGKYPELESWFNTWCKPEGLKRRKALLLYSEKRALGKTEFALSLVNDSHYVVIFRNTFVDAMKDKVPKLLILDDMSPYKAENKETWKALVASQPTAIRDCYLNYNWEYSVPCIITTNNLFLVKQLYCSKEFNTQIVFQEIDDYMGPSGTEPESMFNVEVSFSNSTFDKLQKMCAEGEEKFLSKKRSSDFDLMGKLVAAQAKINLLEEQLKKLKK